MTFIKKVINADTGDADHVGGDQWDLLDDYFDNVATGLTAEINSDTYYRSNRFWLRNPADTFSYKFVTSAIAANRTVTMPLMTADGNMVIDSFGNTFTALQTIKLDATNLMNLVRNTNTNSSDFAITFQAYDSVGVGTNVTDYAQIIATLVSNTDPSETGQLTFAVRNAGTLQSMARITSTGLFNCGGPNRRIQFDETGLTTTRAITFQDVTSKQAALAFANVFTEVQTISKDATTLLTLYRPNNVAATQAYLNFDLQDSANNQNTYAAIRAEIVTNTDTNEGGKVLVYTQSAGSLRAVLQITNAGRLWCGGSNQRIEFDETGLTARRTIQFQDSNYKVAGIDIANTFTATNTFQGKVDLNKNLHFTGVISPTQITADQNNYTPTNLLTSNVVRLDSDTSLRSITGLGDATQTDGQLIKLRNISANTILLKDAFTNKAASSTAANRFDFDGYDYPLFPKCQINLIYDGTLARWVLEDPYEFVLPSPNHGVWYSAERMGGGSTSDGTLSINLATGGTGNGIVGETGHPGAQRFTAGTSATGFACIQPLSTNCIILGNSNYWRFDCIVRIVTISDGTNTYTARFGFIDLNNGESTDAVMFRYTHSVNSGKWVLVARSNSTETAVNATNTAIANNTWYHLTIIVNPAGTSAEFFQDGAYLGEVTTNIPVTSGTRGTGWGFMFLKSAGTTDINVMDIDLLQVISYTPTVR